MSIKSISFYFHDLQIQNKLTEIKNAAYFFFFFFFIFTRQYYLVNLDNDFDVDWQEKA
jgi:hypothetical protein